LSEIRSAASFATDLTRDVSDKFSRFDASERRSTHARDQRGRLHAAATAQGVRIETISTDAETEVARYASLLLRGTYTAEYLRLGLVSD